MKEYLQKMTFSSFILILTIPGNWFPLPPFSVEEMEPRAGNERYPPVYILSSKAVQFWTDPKVVSGRVTEEEFPLHKHEDLNSNSYLVPV